MKFSKLYLIMLTIVIVVGIFSKPFLIINLIAYILFIYVDVYIHEFGHYLAGRMMNMGISRVMLGNGRELWRKKIFDSLFVVSTGLGGTTILGKVTPRLIRLRMFFFALGGTLMQAIIVLLCIRFFGFNLHFIYQINIPAAFVLSNLALILLCLLPYNAKLQGFKRPTDGLTLLKIPKLNAKEINELLSMGDIMDAHELYEKHDYASAIQAYQKCLDKFPASEVAKVNYALCLMKCLRFEEAEQQLVELLEQNHDSRYDSLIFNNLAWLYLLNISQESLSEADKLSKKSMELNPGHPNFRNTRGCVLIELGELAEGIKMLEGQTDLKKPIDTLTNDSTNFMYLAYGYFRKGDLETMNKYLNHLNKYPSKLDPDDAYLFEKLKLRANQYQLL